MLNNKLYEQFHIKTKTQINIINDHNFTYHIIIKILKKYIDRQKSILDIGCGAGTISLYIANKYNTRVHGIDISEKAIKVCKTSANKLGLKNVLFKQVEFPKKSLGARYDMALCFEVIEHLEDDRLAINRIYKLLNTKGILILSTPSANAPLHKLGMTKSFDKRVGHLRRYTEKQLINLFKSENFKIISILKTEGIIRNFLFINSDAGKLIRYIKYPISGIVNIIDQISLSIFGESDIFIIAQKI